MGEPSAHTSVELHKMVFLSLCLMVHFLQVTQLFEVEQYFNILSQLFHLYDIRWLNTLGGAVKS